MKRIVLTREGYTKLKDELDYLKQVKRREIADQLEHARLLGDLSENAEYDAAKDAQAHLEKRIAELSNTISQATIMDNNGIQSDQVLIGASVTVEDLSTNKQDTYLLVSQAEADYENNKISLTSPIGKGLLGHKAGDVVEIKAPKGIIRYKVIKIERIN